jgi:uncharacterized damage-inducible protein DinB
VLSREELKNFLREFPAKDWDIPQKFDFMGGLLVATPHKIIVHVLMHEIWHWAQIATMLRLTGMKGDMQDFLGSPVFGGEFRRAAS